MRSWLEFTFNHRFLVLAFVLSTLAFAIWQIRTLKQDNSIEAMLPKDDPQLKIHHEMRDRFGSDEMTLVAWKSEHLFSNEEIKKIHSLTDALELLDEVEWISSLSNINTVSSDGESINVKPLIDPGKRAFTDLELADLLRKATGDPLLAGTIISAAGEATAITLGVKKISNPEMRVTLMEKVYKILDEHGGRDAYWLAGAAPIHMAYVESISHDGRIFLPAVLIVISLMLWFVFRSITGIVVPFIAMIAVALLTMGAYALAGRTINVVSTMLPPLIMLMTTSAVVHMIAHTRQQKSTLARSAVIAGCATVALPIFLNCLTSGIGFGSLSVSEIIPVRNFGIFAAVGLAMVFFVCMTVVPIVLTLKPVPAVQADAKRAGLSDRLIHGLISQCEKLTLRYRRSILLLCLALFILTAYGISQVRVQTNLMDYFDPQTRVRQDLQHIQEHLTGAMSLDAIVESEGKKKVTEPEIIRYVDGITRDLKAQPVIISAHSISTYLKRTHELFTGETDSLPPTRQHNAQYLLLGKSDKNGRLIRQFIDPVQKNLRITGRTKYVDTRQGAAVEKWLLERLEQDKPEGVVTYLSGIIPVYINMVFSLVGGQVRGFALALGLIGIVMILLQRSVRIGLAAMVPNVLPVVITAGLMGFAGIPLNSATAMISSIAIGIAVDDTIHFTTFFSRFRKEGLSTEAALSKVLHAVGPAMLTTSMVLATGFGVLMLSNFAPLRMFGLLSALTMLSAVIGDLIVLPTLLSLVDKRDVKRVSKPA